MSEKVNRDIAKDFLVDELDARIKSGSGYLHIDEIVDIVIAERVKGLPEEMVRAFRWTTRRMLNIKRIRSVLAKEFGFPKACLARATYVDAREANGGRPLTTLADAKAYLPSAGKAISAVIVVDDRNLFDASGGRDLRNAGGKIDSRLTDVRKSQLRVLPDTEHAMTDVLSSAKDGRKLLGAKHA